MLDPTAEELSLFPFHRRRNSDSGQGRILSRNSQRYGVVGAPNPSSNERILGNDPLSEGSDNQPQPSESNRSWITYVLDGSYPENHSILTTPSLFTNSPNYEEMLLLSSLLGPTNPPVVTTDDVTTAGGLFTIISVDDCPYAQAIEGEERMSIVPGENCIVCLSPYHVGEAARRLKLCGHFFHRECIDQVCSTLFKHCLAVKQMLTEKK